MTVDLNNIIKTFNTAAEEITGFPRTRVQGLNIQNIFPEFLPYLNKETIDEQAKARIEIIIQGRKKKKSIWVCPYPR